MFTFLKGLPGALCTCVSALSLGLEPGQEPCPGVHHLRLLDYETILHQLADVLAGVGH